MVEQVKAMRSTLHKKPERKPLFFRGGPPSARQAEGSEGVEPKASDTGRGHTRRAKAKPRQRGLRTNSCMPQKRCLSQYSDIAAGECGCKTTNTARLPAASRQVEGSHKNLEGDNKRPVGVKHSKGLSGGLPVQTPTESTTSHSTILCGTESANCGGGEGTSGQRSHNRSPQPSGRVLLNSPKEGRRSETSDKLEGSEQLCSHRALQNGGNSHPQRPRQSGGLASESGFEGHLLCDPNPQDSPSVSQVLLSEQMLSVSVPSIWPVVSSLGLYQDPKASTSPPPGDGGTTDSLYRQYPGPGGVTGTSQDASGGTSIPPAVLRFQSKPKEVSIRASPSDGIPELYCRYSSDGAEAPWGKNKKDPCGITGIITRGTSLRQSPGSTGGEDECNITSYSPSSSVLPPSSDGSIRVPECTLSVLRGTSSPDTGMQGGTDMVGHPHDKLEWKVPSEEGSGHSNRLRCLTDGLGSNQSKPEDRRSMVTGREQYAHQLPGVAGSNIGSEDILEKQNQDVGAPQVGQYRGSGIHKQPGGDSLQGIGRLSKGIMDVVPGEEHPHHSPTPTRCSECDSRCRVLDYDRQRSDWQLNPVIFDKIVDQFGPVEVDLFASRLTTHYPGTHVHGMYRQCSPVFQAGAAMTLRH